MNKKIALLVIDGQNDFMDLPDSKLAVPGACKDMERVANFILKNMNEIDTLIFTLDSHRTIDISHPVWWQKSDGTLVAPFTPISSADVKAGVFAPRFKPSWSIGYVEKLEQQGEFGHFIWPYHCIIGSIGAALYDPLQKAALQWEEKRGRIIQYVTKGDNALTEHFGAFRANIEVAEDPKTQFNQQLIKTLMDHQTTYLAGEAKSHCVANSLRQAVTEVPQLAPKLVILEDCMSDVPGLPAGFYAEVDKIYQNAKNDGAKFAKSTDPLAVAV